MSNVFLKALDSAVAALVGPQNAATPTVVETPQSCLLYTSDAADDLLCVDLGGRRIIKKKRTKVTNT